MSRLKLDSLSIQNYRSLRDLSLGPVGRLNLITGPNNVGKTSLLEAVRLWASKTDISALLEIIDAREESAMPDRGLNVDRRDDSSLLGCLYLYSGYPQFDTVYDSILISGGECTLSISILGEGSSSDLLDEPVTSLEGLQTSRHLELRTDSPDRAIKVGLPSYYGTRLFNQMTRRAGEDRPSAYPCEFLPSMTMGNRRSHSAAALWDKIALTNKEEAVLRGLNIIDKDIKDFGFIDGGERNGRIPVVRISGVDRPIPLRGLGDGVTRIFEIMLALVNSENGFLLVDEFENGLHYSIQSTAWETVLELSELLNVQVFATTHSNDCVNAFQHVAGETRNEDSMILTRLISENGAVRSETLRREKLTRRLELGREVR